MNFGAQVLSHPLIVDAAENCFIPVCILNNTKGDADARVRERFHEPAWNNPVVRVMNTDGRSLAPRLDRDWTVAGVAEQMLHALTKRKQTVPTYLKQLAIESRAHRRGVETAIFGMT